MKYCHNFVSSTKFFINSHNKAGDKILEGSGNAPFASVISDRGVQVPMANILMNAIQYLDVGHVVP